MLITLQGLEQMQDHAESSGCLTFFSPQNVGNCVRRGGGPPRWKVWRGWEGRVSRDRKIKQIALRVQSEHPAKGMFKACRTRRVKVAYGSSWPSLPRRARRCPRPPPPRSWRCRCRPRCPRTGRCRSAAPCRSLQRERALAMFLRKVRADVGCGEFTDGRGSLALICGGGGGGGVSDL